jgi:perosamine synthetase
MKQPFIPVNEPLLTPREKELLNECIETGWISSEGPFVARFEAATAKITGRTHGVAVANGSAALDIAVAALKIGQGDEVILPTHTIISCAASIVRAGAKPVVVDSDPDTWNMDVQQIEAKITSRTKAIMAVHIYGLPADMDPILSLAKKYDLKIIEDAAQMIGQTYRGRPCGGFGDISTFSFYPNKHITTGEGGMVLTNDDNLAERSRSLRNLCFKPEKRFEHDELGWNYRMTNLQAALGVAQIERLPYHVELKRKLGTAYRKLLDGTKHLQHPIERQNYAENIYWVYGLMLDDDFALDATQMMKQLSDRGIGTRPFFWPIHEQPVLRKMGLFENESYPIAERMARRGFYIPSGIATTPDQQERVAMAVRDVIEKHSRL